MEDIQDTEVLIDCPHKDCFYSVNRNPAIVHICYRCSSNKNAENPIKDAYDTFRENGY